MILEVYQPFFNKVKNYDIVTYHKSKIIYDSININI